MALPPLVLVVDDLADHREMYSEFLSFEGLRVSEASTGESALAIALEQQPAVIVLDLGLPVMDGWETLRRLRDHPRTRQVPVVVLSGHEGTEARARAAQAGCDAFLVKPCLPDELLRAVRTMIERPR